MSDNWKSFALKIKNEFKIHLIDQRNHGKSFHSNEFNYKILAQDLKFYIDFQNSDEEVDFQLQNQLKDVTKKFKIIGKYGTVNL